MLHLTDKQKKDLKFLTAIMLFLCIFILILDAFLSGEIKNFYKINCEQQNCQVQTTTWFGLGSTTQTSVFHQPKVTSLRYNNGRLPNFCIEIKGTCLPFKFYFKKSAENLQNIITSAHDFKYCTFSLMLRWFLLVYGTGFLIAFAIIIMSKKTYQTK